MMDCILCGVKAVEGYKLCHVCGKGIRDNEPIREPLKYSAGVKKALYQVDCPHCLNTSEFSDFNFHHRIEIECVKCNKKFIGEF